MLQALRNPAEDAASVSFKAVMASNASQPGHGQVSQRHVCECGSYPAATGLTGETWGHGPETQWFQISDAGAERG